MKIKVFSQSLLKVVIHYKEFIITLLLLCSMNSAMAETIVGSQQIISQLSEPDHPIFRSFIPRANPDSSTRVCDSKLNDKLLSKSGKHGEELTRTLYVESAANIDLDIAFKKGEATLLSEGIQQLDNVAQALKSNSLANNQFVLAGHTDTEGGMTYNDRLSCERALSVRNYLRDHHHIDEARLVPMGFGYLKLKDPSQPLSAVNRRVEIRKSQGLTSAH